METVDIIYEGYVVQVRRFWWMQTTSHSPRKDLFLKTVDLGTRQDFRANLHDYYRKKFHNSK